MAQGESGIGHPIDTACPLTPDDVLATVCADPGHRQQVAGAVRGQIDRGIHPADIPADLADLARRMAANWTLPQTRSAYQWFHAREVQAVLREIERDA